MAIRVPSPSGDISPLARRHLALLGGGGGRCGRLEAGARRLLWYGRHPEASIAARRAPHSLMPAPNRHPTADGPGAVARMEWQPFPLLVGGPPR
jgi:hypothetical protein